MTTQLSAASSTSIRSPSECSPTAMLLAPKRWHMFRFFFSSRRRHTRSLCDWSSDVCSSDLLALPPQAGMDVTGAPDPRVVGLGHERDRAAVQVRDLLGAVLVDGMIVGHRHGICVAEVDLLLAWPRLTLRALDRDPGAVHPVTDLTQERLGVRGREHVVVEDVWDGRSQLAVVLRMRLLEALLEQVELELGADHRLVADRPRTLHLRLQDLTRRRCHGRAVVPDHVAKHECRPLEPRDAAERSEVRLESEVPVALLPARDRV